MSALGGREGLARSLGSVYASAVSRFLCGSFTGSRFHRARRSSRYSDDATVFDVSQDGTRLFVGMFTGLNLMCQLCVLRTTDGAVVSTVTGCAAVAVAVAPDDTVYVLQWSGRVRVLDPSLEERGTIELGARSVSASVDYVAFGCHPDVDEHEVVIVRRCDHEILRRIKCAEIIGACCFTAAGTQVAVAHVCRIAVHNVMDGECARLWNIKSTNCDELRLPLDIKSTDFDELVLLQPHDHGTDLTVYDGSGRILKDMHGSSNDSFHGIAVRGGAVITACFQGSDLCFDVYV